MEQGLMYLLRCMTTLTLFFSFRSLMSMTRESMLRQKQESRPMMRLVQRLTLSATRGRLLILRLRVRLLLKLIELHRQNQHWMLRLQQRPAGRLMRKQVLMVRLQQRQAGRPRLRKTFSHSLMKLRVRLTMI